MTEIIFKLTNWVTLGTGWAEGKLAECVLWLPFELNGMLLNVESVRDGSGNKFLFHFTVQWFTREKRENFFSFPNKFFHPSIIIPFSKEKIFFKLKSF